MVSQDNQIGLTDEPIGDREAQAAIKKWIKAKDKASDIGGGVSARAVLKAVDDARDQARDLLPGFDDGQEHRFTFIDETAKIPMQYVVHTRPGPPDKKIGFTRHSQARLTVEQTEAKG